MEEYGEENDFRMPLEGWLKKNRPNILVYIEVVGENCRITQPRLSCEVRQIIRRILKKFKSKHDNSIVCASNLTVQEICLRQNLDVKLNINWKKGETFNEDFIKIKSFIKEVLSYATPPPSSIGTQEAPCCPKDVEHYIDLINGKLNREQRNFLFMHPCIWGPVDVIKRVQLFALIYNWSRQHVKKKIKKYAACIPDEINKDWWKVIPPCSAYSTYHERWSDERRCIPKRLEILFYMKDAYSHLHQHVAQGKQPLPITEEQLFALFPSFLAHFAASTCRIAEYSGVYALPFVEENSIVARDDHAENSDQQWVEVQRKKGSNKVIPKRASTSSDVPTQVTERHSGDYSRNSFQALSKRNDEG